MLKRVKSAPTDTITRADSRRGEPQRLARPPRRGPRAATSIRRAVRLGEKTKAVGPPQPAPCACQAIEAQRGARCAATAISCPPPLTSPFRPRSPICVSRPRTNPIYQRLDCVRTRSLHRCGRAQVRSAECEASVAVRSRGSRLKRGSRCACSSTVVSTQLRSTQLRLPGGDSDPVHAEVKSSGVATLGFVHAAGTPAPHRRNTTAVYQDARAQNHESGGHAPELRRPKTETAPGGWKG
ncbi:hypothetical protein C8R43DRAFT_1037896, partial [Mycena crocata]